MKTKFLFFALLLAGFLVACSNEEETASKNSDPDSYFPLTNQNLWSYKKVGDNLTEKTNFMITGEKTIAGKTYFMITSQAKDTLFLRKDGAGNVLEFSPEGDERMFVPKNPVLDKYWISTDSIDSVCVTSVSKVINAYSDLIQITTYARNETNESNYKSQNYFKKDVGCVQFNRVDWDNSYTLYSFELQ